MKKINVSHRSAALGSDALRRQDEHDRVVQAHRLAERVDAIPPPAPRPSPAPPSIGSSRAQTRTGAPSAPAPTSGTAAATSAPPSGPRVIEVGKARKQQAERRARLSELDRLDAALDRALSEQRYTGGLGW